jgi:hypothetical protein
MASRVRVLLKNRHIEVPVQEMGASQPGDAGTHNG